MTLSDSELTEATVANEIIQKLDEYQASDLVKDVVKVIGADRAQDFYNRTLEIEKNGGVMTKLGDRRRTPGGVFFNQVRSNISEIERELLFPYGREELPISYLLKEIESFSSTQLEVGVKQVEKKLAQDPYLDNIRRSRLLKFQQILLRRISELKSQEAGRSINDIRQEVDGLSDEVLREKLLARIQNLETIIKEKGHISELSLDVEQERQKMQIQLEAEERRAKTRITYFEKFLARESIATLVGSILLIIITVTLIIAMLNGIVEAKILENGFLVLLGYFFGQTVSKATNKTEKQEE